MKSTEKYNVVFFWKQNDSGLYGRRQDMLVKYLAASERVDQIVHFDAPISIIALIKLFGLRASTQSRHIFKNTLERFRGKKHTEKIKRYVHIHRPKNKFFGRLFYFLPTYGSVGWHINRILQQHGIGERRTIFYICPITFEFPWILQELSPDFIICDVIDDQRAFLDKNYHFLRTEYTKNYSEILELSDLAISNCENVKKAFTKIRPDIEVIPNACEYYNQITRIECPESIRNIEGPIIGYVGNLSVRINVDLLEYVAREKSHWNLLLIGSTGKAKEIRHLRKFRNVHFTGPVPYDNVVAYIDQFDVAIVPHTVDSMTDHMNPLKIFVYCSRGVPVVTTDIQNVGELKELIDVASDHKDFIKKIESALENRAKAPQSDANVQAILKRNSWPRRIDRLFELIDEREQLNFD